MQLDIDAVPVDLLITLPSSNVHPGKHGFGDKAILSRTQELSTIIKDLAMFE